MIAYAYIWFYDARTADHPTGGGMIRLLAIIAIVGVLCGCSLQNIKIYEGPDRPPSEQITLSSVGLYPERRLSLRVLEIDGKEVSTGKAASYLLLPGSYQVKIDALKDFEPGIAVITFKKALVLSRLEARAGHTYIANAVIDGDRISVFFEDKGLDFPLECLPLYRQVNSPNRSVGLGLYSTDKKCNL
jgi:hypothetical protein